LPPGFDSKASYYQNIIKFFKSSPEVAIPGNKY